MSAAPVEPIEITSPGVFDIPHDVYLADPVSFGSLSASGAKLLLPPSCPAIFHARRSLPVETSDAFDLGHAAHALTLGAGPPIAEVKADSWRTKAAQEAAAEARAAGATPLLTADVQRVQAMSAALREHPLAGRLFQRDGAPEQSLFWQDDDTGIYLRARLDWLPEGSDGRMVLIDFKTAKSANPALFGKSAADYGYFLQERWYCDGVKALGLADDAVMVFVVQEKTPPYITTVCQLDAEFARAGERDARKARRIFAECMDRDEWPTYTNEIAVVSPPRWFRYEED